MSYKINYNKWLSSSDLSHAERSELQAVIGNEKEIESRFFSSLSFGTAGLRGIMGTGTALMNVHTVRHATQAFANVILHEGFPSPEVAVCFDCRNNSADFARAAACVLAANGIRVRIFEDMRPTPELSFAVREYGCAAGINITASHNPKEYNGYKVYWSDGAQLPPAHAAAIAAEMQKLDVFSDVKTMSWSEAMPLVTVMGKETDEKFLANVMAQSGGFDMASVADSFKMVYTPFHGAGRLLVPEVLRRAGLKHISCVPEQMEPDGSFPTVKSPNPENPESFYLAAALADKLGADFILGTDPDADRVGILTRDRGGEFKLISGNKTGVLLLDYLISSYRCKGGIPENPAVLKTIVTTEMARSVAKANGIDCIDTFTGFKFMAEKKNELEKSGSGHVIFAYEESYGYMIGDFVRDKDAVTASLLLCEMAAFYFSKGITLSEALDGLYEKYGCFAEKTINLIMPGLEGLSDMRSLMARLRAEPTAEISGMPVAEIRDYLFGEAFSSAGGRKLELSGSDVLGYTLADGTNVYVRPSGTEPKIKIYALARGETISAAEKTCDVCESWARSLTDG